ncbi:MAG: porin [Nitrospirae bacterium]|nr:porin [Nitrospirota bacterium]
MFKGWSKNIAVSLVMLIGLSQVSRADEAKAPPAPKWYDTINVSGFVDAYYSYNGNTSGTGSVAGDGNVYHNFDMKANDLNVSLVELSIVKPIDDKNPAGFTVTLGIGEAADVIACGGPCGSSAEAPYKNVLQAYASMLLIPGLQLDFGKYVTQMGAEVIESKSNWNYTRSLLFVEAIPYYHSGARLTYTVNDMLFVQGQVANGWNNVAENNNGKYYGIQFGVTPIKPLPIIINYAVSSEYAAGGGTNDALSLLDIIATYNVTDSLSLMANYDMASQKQGVSATQDAKWDGIAIYGKYAFTPTTAVAIRAEQFNDSDGYRTGVNAGTGGQKLTEETLTLEHNSSAIGCLVRLELRHDSTDADSSVSPFIKDDGTGTQSQDTVTVGVVHTF